MFLLNNIVKIRKFMMEIAKNYMKLRGRLSHEFAIFDNFFFHRLTICIAVKPIFVNNLSLASVRIPLLLIVLYYNKQKSTRRILNTLYFHSCYYGRLINNVISCKMRNKQIESKRHADFYFCMLEDNLEGGSKL